MNDDRQLIIPTRFKGKVSQNLSYPAGAKEVSEALISVPQFSELQLSFWTFQFRHEWPRGDYVFLEFGPTSLWPTHWLIEVKPVPRVMRHRFHQYIAETALP